MKDDRPVLADPYLGHRTEAPKATKFRVKTSRTGLRMVQREMLGGHLKGSGRAP
jgi:hypothetical protein